MASGKTEAPAFVTSTWNGLPRWACGLCPWDTLDGVTAMREHIAERHTVVVAEPLPAEVARDRYGNAVTASVVEGDDGTDAA